MPIQITQQDKLDGTPSITITVDNGELKALNTIEAKWNFQDKESFLKFAFSVFLRAEDNKIWVKSEGNPRQIEPIRELLKSDPKNDDQV